MRHVLEHFHDPQTVLRKVRHVLSDNGILYVAVPDAGHPTKRLRSFFFRVVHLSYFTARSLSDMLRMTGFDIIKVTEGDVLERHEVFAFCRKGEPEPMTPDPKAFERQMRVYSETGRMDWFHDLKAGTVSLFRKLGLIRS
jgi:hypothetical protein